MKEKYSKPITDVKKFKSVDIITTSNGGDVKPDDNLVDGSDGWD
jgi:hypothetical protein